MDFKLGAAACGLGFALLVVACGGGGASGETPPPKSPEATSSPGTATNSAETASAGAAAPTFAEQAATGQKLYAENCASCHGAGGEGGKAPRLVGLSQGALPLEPPTSAKYRKAPFKTAADVAGFVVKAMPPGQAGKLTEEQYWAILAFDLKANGVDLGNRRLDASSAPSVVIHP